MARIQTSALINNISGKLNGSVFQRNQGGLILRSQGGKINSNTQRSNYQKVGMSQMQGDWQTLSDLDRSLWKTYSLYLGKKQKKNPNLIINGQQLFLNINAIRYSLSPVITLFQPYLLVTPLLTPIPPPISILSITVDLSGLIIHLDRVTDNSKEVVICFLSSPLSGSQTSVYKKMTLIKNVTNNSDTFSATSYYVEVYGRLPNIGEWLQTKIAIYSTDSENYSSYSISRIQVS